MKHYSKIPQHEGNGCCESCRDQTLNVNEYGKSIVYSEEDLNSVPSGANLALGCGNSLVLEEIKLGDTVVDLSSGAGFSDRAILDINQIAAYLAFVNRLAKGLGLEQENFWKQKNS